ncbi:MAG: hypothetical protein LKF87_05175 [Clostridium tyrobutyricum]|jgi:hypothetical protein|uniref:hypothetical protein n=1 Tax=Clostridium tyrobutyricum TaxID=1519 RepID=UPI00057F4741|nr:hypothetical protein [Clostridium tyrobutyricum]MBV4421734.1 hypothetical protein [Clostridium tyrobutyricum]MBV4437625.1 hypothetical protein [Clostridium tyrobutyricum]MBV4446126.1 hypothetical protein [Clostridium tyrobutyricum]MCH4199830.1 hypothetical protein [Clostridium tyrobutyricum]MCH4238056.1 hypothetical protein [Clostridium tyrobutyricum]
MKLKTLLFTGIIATMVATPVFAYPGHAAYTDEYNTRRGMCQLYGPEHSVALVITHNTSAKQTYALSACGCNGHSVGTRVTLNGVQSVEVHKQNYAQTSSLSAPGTLVASEMHRVDN